jgi:predicted nucleic acid-binding protein
MADNIILLDTSVLIDFYRKTNKANSFFYRLSAEYQYFGISIVTKYEILVGSKPMNRTFWEQFLQNFQTFDFDNNCCLEAVRIRADLKQKNKMIEIPDLFIGATAKFHNLTLATLNKKHFDRISELDLVTVI